FSVSSSFLKISPFHSSPYVSIGKLLMPVEPNIQDIGGIEKFEKKYFRFQTHLAFVIFIHNLIALQVQHLNCRAHYDWI
ncbi:hypothetical protein ACMD2_24302, partial [Ananas comosus]